MTTQTIKAQHFSNRHQIKNMMARIWHRYGQLFNQTMTMR